jgi:hypothetical protein
VYQQQQQQEQQQQQDAENPFLDPPFSRIKKATLNLCNLQKRNFGGFIWCAPESCSVNGVHRKQGMGLGQHSPIICLGVFGGFFTIYACLYSLN